MRNLLIHFARFGPYHHARLKSAAEALAPLGWKVTGLETAGSDSTYAWDETRGAEAGPQVITAFPGRVHEDITAAECKRVLLPLLDELNPDATAIAGWSARDAVACLGWCRKNGAKAIVMSETREADGKRVWWKERIKRYLISRYDGALVGGKSHRDYLVKLGMPAERIRLGYNVVDNAYFSAEAEKWRKSGLSSQFSEFQLSAFSPPFFLVSNRFIERKNLSRLIEAYSSCTQQSTINSQPSTLWNLCLLGDGELKTELIAKCRELNLNAIESAPWESPPVTNSTLSDSINHRAGSPVAAQAGSLHHRGMSQNRTNSSFPFSDFQISAFSSPSVYFPGFRQIGELPRFYAHAGCFVHPAMEEPWGLVLNEAMACGLPVLSGTNVGAAEELIVDGVNGWTIDAGRIDSMAEAMGRIAGLPATGRQEMGAASARILAERSPTEAFGRGLAEILGQWE